MEILERINIKVNWFKNNRNKLPYKILAFIFPSISPSLSYNLEFYKAKKDMEGQAWEDLKK